MEGHICSSLVSGVELVCLEGAVGERAESKGRPVWDVEASSVLIPPSSAQLKPPGMCESFLDMIGLEGRCGGRPGCWQGPENIVLL